MSSRQLDGNVGPELILRGRLTGRSDLRVQGTVEGEVELEGTLIVSPEGRVVAPLDVDELEVEGSVRGNVRALSAVAVRPGGRLIGDVRAPRIAIDDGGALQGGIEMEFDDSTDDEGHS